MIIPCIPILIIEVDLLGLLGEGLHVAIERIFAIWMSPFGGSVFPLLRYSISQEEIPFMEIEQFWFDTLHDV